MMSEELRQKILNRKDLIKRELISFLGQCSGCTIKEMIGGAFFHLRENVFSDFSDSDMEYIELIVDKIEDALVIK